MGDLSLIHRHAVKLVRAKLSTEIPFVAQRLSNVWLGAPSIGHRIKIEKSKINGLICHVRGPLGANLAIFSLTDFVIWQPNCFQKTQAAPEPQTREDQFLHWDGPHTYGTAAGPLHCCSLLYCNHEVGALYCIVYSHIIHSIL